VTSRRSFIKTTALGIPFIAVQCKSPENSKNATNSNKLPLIISTWSHEKPNKLGLKVLENGGSSLDATEKAIMEVENDPMDLSVGYGGLPDREGNVTLDACIMDNKGKAGSVSFVQNFKNPISIARKVMENTPHVMLTGAGAEKFALESGFEKTDLMTKANTKAYQEWLKEGIYKPKVNAELHDTVGLLTIDKTLYTIPPK